MDFFNAETLKTIEDINNVREQDDLCFAILTNSHVSDEGETTCANIKAVDSAVHFDFVCHLGNISNGDNPKRPTMNMLERELNMYRGATASDRLFVTQGDADGWRDERFLGQMIHSIITDEDWSKATDFIDSFENVSRPEGKSYYYVDFPKHNVRLIFLCSYHSQYDAQTEFFEKYVGYDANEVKWLKDIALRDCEGKTVLIFSHRIPKSRFETGADPFIYKGNSTEPILAILQQAQRRGVDIACVFGGAYNLDESICVGGINYSVMSSQLATGRELGTVEQDLWDAAVVKKNEKKIYLFRYGAGCDRVIEF